MIPSFPSAEQAQIIRAHQRDLYYVGSLREQLDSVLRSWLGSRWMTRWDKEVELGAKLLYYGLTTGRATQTLGEEYTRIWQLTSTKILPPSILLRTLLILITTLPSYMLARWTSFVSPDFETKFPSIKKVLRILAPTLETLTEINLTLFYFGGPYYDLSKRLLGIKHLTTIRPDPRIHPPSYSFLGVLLSIKLLHRLITVLRSSLIITPGPSEKSQGKRPERYPLTASTSATIDDRPIIEFLDAPDPADEPAKAAEDDERTMLDIRVLTRSERATRTCTLCLEERTDTTATECGHLFCWTCIVGWGREKAECPLCRQGLSVAKLLPLYNI